MPSATAARSSSQDQETHPTKSGIITDQNGERHIPSSRRADGSVRREIRVRPGYRPPEDVEVYKNRTAEAWKNRGKGGVPGADFVAAESKPKAASKTKAAKTSGEERVKEKEIEAPAQALPPTTTSLTQTEEEDPDVLKEKEAKKLSKKLRQARDLEQKKEKGDSLLPEQFEKVIRINELIRQLDNLGFDADANRKES